MFLFALFLPVQLLAVNVTGISVCPTRSVRAASGEVIVSPRPVIRDESLNCVLTLTHINPGSWVGIFKEKLYIWKAGSGHCSTQPISLAITHSAGETRHFCGESIPNVIYTGYSENSSAITIHLSVQADYNSPDAYDIQLQYRVARVIYSGKNVQLTEDMKERDSIVSHSYYPQQIYDANINSSLVLKNAKLGSRVQIKFYKRDLAGNCADYLRVTGIASLKKDNSMFCGAMVASLGQWMEYVIISSTLSFNFVSTNSSNRKGFRLDYRVEPNEGCSEPKIAQSSVRVNTSDGTYQLYSVECDLGLHFSDKAGNVTSLRVVCSRETWWILSACTDKCRNVDDECLQRCGVTDNALNQLQCVPLTATNAPQSSSVGVAVGVSVAAAALAVAACLVVFFLLRRIAGRREPKQAHASAELELPSNDDNKRIAEVPLTTGENNSTRRMVEGEYSKLNAHVAGPSDVLYSEPVNAADMSHSPLPAYDTYYLAAPVGSNGCAAANPYEMPVAVIGDSSMAEDPLVCTEKSVPT